MGKYPEALKELEYTAQFTPLVGQDPLYEMVALIYASQADFAHATEALRKQVAVNPNNADAHRRLADGYVRQERTLEAMAEFTAALLIDRRNVLSLVGISQLQFRAGNHEAAARAARSALQVEPSYAEARYVLAMSLMRAGQSDEGKRELQEFQRLQAEAADVSKRKYEIDGLRREIDIATAAGDFGTAIPLLQQIIQREPDVASHYTALGLAFERTNQTPEAIEAFTTALKQRAPVSGRGLSRGWPDGSQPARGRSLSRVDRDRQEAAGSALRQSLTDFFVPFAIFVSFVFQKSSWPLILNSRPSTMRCGCCHAARLLLRIKSSLEFIRL
jgi:tetratricopeptide (TPR) repeat protein